MSGVNFVFNDTLAEVKTLCGLPAANDALIMMLLETSGLETDAVLRDKDDFAAILSGTTNEQMTMGRKTISASVTIVVDDTLNEVRVDIPDQTYALASGNAFAKTVLGYDPDTTGGTDSAIRPLTAHSTDATPDGNDLDIRIDSTGFFGATSAA